MARVSEKALRPRQYVISRLSAERIAALTPGVRKLLHHERAASASARAARALRERNEAARHAQNIMSGVQAPDPESDAIRALEQELEELHAKKRSLFAALKASLEAGDAKREEERGEQLSTRRDGDSGEPVKVGKKGKDEKGEKDVGKEEGVKHVKQENEKS